MTEQYGLRTLQVRVPGHWQFRMLVRRGLPRAERTPYEGRDYVADRFLDVHPDIERDLVVTGPGGMQPERWLSNQLEEPTLYVHVDVFKFWTPGKVLFVDLTPDPGKSIDYGLTVVMRDDLLLASILACATDPAMSCL